MADPILQAFQNSLLSIAPGSITKVADEAGLSRTVLARLRAGKQLNVTIKTLAKLAQAMGKTTDEMLGLSPPTEFARVPTVSPSTPGLTLRELDRVMRHLSRVVTVIEDARGELAQPQPPTGDKEPPR